MTQRLPALDQLPSQNATHVKNKWGEVVRQVQARGTVAVTNHSNVELVMLSAHAYQALVETFDRLQVRDQADLDSLTHQFNARLESLQLPDAHDRLARVMARKGKSRKAPIAGETF